MHKKILSMIVFFVLTLPVHSQSADMTSAFGIAFGQTVIKVRELGAVIDKDNQLSNEYTEWYKVKRFPKHPADTAFGLIGFTTAGLQKIVWVSEDITSDADGSKGRDKFSYYEEIINKKYNLLQPSKKYQISGAKLYKESDEFYQCLKYGGCGMWASVWTGAWGSTILEIQTSGKRGEGWLRLSYEGPKWADAVEATKKGQEHKDQNAF